MAVVCDYKAVISQLWIFINVYENETPASFLVSQGATLILYPAGYVVAYPIQICIVYGMLLPKN